LTSMGAKYSKSLLEVAFRTEKGGCENFWGRRGRYERTGEKLFRKPGGPNVATTAHRKPREGLDPASSVPDGERQKSL